MSIDLIRRLRKIATLESEDYGAEPQDHSSWQAADLIERQAAQIEGLNEQVAELERAKEYKYVEQVLRPIKILIALAQSAETLAENSEETENSSGKIALGMPSDFETLSENLDLLDELPDDKPGYTLSGAAKAAWALRDLLGENYD